MQETDKIKILNFLLRVESIKEFETWIYNEHNLESRIDSELYQELLGFNYNDKFAIDKLSRFILGKYISEDDFEKFKYESFLRNSGWHPNRRINIELSEAEHSSEIKNAIKILEEFGNLKLNSPNKRNNSILTYIQFFDKPGAIENMKKFGLNENLVCFAQAHNGHIDLFVDKNNKFYQLDNVVCEDLYEYTGLGFEHMMKELIELKNVNNFRKIGNHKDNNNRRNKKSLWDKIKETIANTV